VAAIAGAMVVGLAPAGAQAPAATPDSATVAASIEQTGWYADAGANPGPDQLTSLAASTADDIHPIAFAVLAAEPQGSSQSFAYDVLDALPPGGRFETVVVLSPADIGIDSDYWDDRAINAALDATQGAIRVDPSSGLNLLASALASQTLTTLSGHETETDVAGGSGGEQPVDVGVYVLIGLGLVALWGMTWLVRGEQYERIGDNDESTWDRRRRYQRYTGGSSGWRSSSSYRSSSSSHRSSSSSSSGHSHRGSGGRRL
jgi:hypothetical protein